VLAAAVIVLQAGGLLTLIVTGSWEPPRVRALEVVWTLIADAAMYPLLLLLIGGPLLTWAACSVDKRKWTVLSLSWGIFGLTLVLGFGAQAQLMLRSLWEQLPILGRLGASFPGITGI
jgi:hypothetical protein